MKQKSIIVVMLCVALLISGCSKSQETESESLMVLAAASLTDVLTEIKSEYEQYQDEYTLDFSFDSSGTLKTQIEQGVDADLFLSASPLPVEELVEEGFILKEQVVDLLQNEIVLISNQEIANPIDSFEELVTSDEVEMIATCMAEVPIGQYTIQLYENLVLAEELAGKANYASNVRQVLDWVASGNIPYGIVYATDAAIEEDVKVQAVADPSLYDQVVYQAAVIAASDNEEAAEAFLEFLQSDTAKQLFEKYGFETIQ